MVAEIRIHNDDKVARGELQPVDVGRAEPELARAGVEFNFRGAVGGDELLCDLLRAVGGAVVDDEELPVEVGGVEGLRDQVGDDGEVGALVVGGEDDCVFVGGG